MKASVTILRDSRIARKYGYPGALGEIYPQRPSRFFLAACARKAAKLEETIRYFGDMPICADAVRRSVDDKIQEAF